MIEDEDCSNGSSMVPSSVGASLSGKWCVIGEVDCVGCVVGGCLGVCCVGTVVEAVAGVIGCGSEPREGPR